MKRCLRIVHLGQVHAEKRTNLPEVRSLGASAGAAAEWRDVAAGERRCGMERRDVAAGERRCGMERRDVAAGERRCGMERRPGAAAVQGGLPGPSGQVGVAYQVG